jgi:CarD family transcriptional regulator, regulator of rRNA transcription
MIYYPLYKEKLFRLSRVLKKDCPMFNLDDRVVYPGHGVARVNRIIEKVISGQVTLFYELKFLNKDMTILVPTNNVAHNGMRSLCSEDKIHEIFNFLAQPAKKLPNAETVSTNWKQRKKEYDRKLHTGNLDGISEIYRELKHIEYHKELSFCEKNLLQQTEMLLAEEIAYVKQFGEEKALEQLRSFFNTMQLQTTVIKQKLI